MGKYRLIAFDMDGTLLNSQKQISQGSLAAIDSAVKAGKTVCLCTGRCIPELEEYFPVTENIRYLICESGVFGYDKLRNEYLFHDPMDVCTAAEIMRRMRDSCEDVMIHIHCDRSIVQRDKIPLMDRYFMGVYRPLYERTCFTVEDICSFFLDDPFSPNKINVYCRSEEQRDRIHRSLSDLNVDFKHVEGKSLECIPEGRTKGTGLKKLCDHLSIPAEQAIAVGDADNDIEMFEAAGFAIAMGNSNRNILSIADAVVSDNDHDGCAEAIMKYLL